MKRVRILLVVLIILIVSGGLYSSSPAGEEASGPQKEKAVSTPTSPSGHKATIKPRTDKGVSVITPTGEKPAQTLNGKKKTPEVQADKKATLTLQEGPNNTMGIDLVNSVPIRGVQFTISGVTMTEVRTTSRTPGFLAKFNEDTGIVILVSTAADEIPPGAGSVVDVIGKKVPGSEVTLSSIRIVDANRALIE